MVTLGRIPDPVAAPFFRVQPALKGTFRWSGTTILIFTPDPAVQLPHSTRYTVTVDATATAVSGRHLAAPYVFSFTTPTVKLLATNWYRRGDRYNGAVVVALRFNQRVRAADLLQHLQLRYQSHQWKQPSLSPAAQERLRATDPAGLQAFEAKLAAANAAASSTDAVAVTRATTWDTKRLGKADPTLVVLQTTTVPPPESWIRAEVGVGMPGIEGRATSPRPQSYTMQLEETFFVDDPTCAAQCDPDRWNPLRLRREALTSSVRKAFSATDVTAATARPLAKTASAAREGHSDRGTHYTLEDLGFDRQKPASTYAVRLDPALKALDGQSLGYPWTAVIENWHERAFTSFGDGHGVWESSGGPVLPFYARNFTSLRQWIAPIPPSDLMPTLVDLQKKNFSTTPGTDPASRKLTPKPDTIQSHGLDLSQALTGGRGFVWAAVEEGKPIARAHTYGERTRATVVQVTNLGLTVKDSPQNTLVFVTRLDTAAPVEGAKVSIVTLENTVAWTGTTNADGVAIAPALPLRKLKRWYETRFDFLVLAEKDGDTAYLGSDWTEGITPWEFGADYDPAEQQSLLRGTVFADRGVYRLGEEVHFKAILRHDTPAGIKVPDAGTPVHVSVRDSQDREIDRRTVTLSPWGSVEWTETLPADGALGNYSVRMRLRPFDQPAPRPSTELVRELDVEGRVESADEAQEPRDSISGGFLVAAYRRPDFRVDATLTSATPYAGTPLDGARLGPVPVRGPDEGRARPLDLHALGRLRRAGLAPRRLPARRVRVRDLAAVLGQDRDQGRRGGHRRRGRLHDRARDERRRRHPLRVPDRGRDHRRLAPADRQPRVDCGAPGGGVRRRQAAVLRRSGHRHRRRAGDPDAGRRAGAGHADHGHGQPRAVDQHAAGGRQRLLHLGYRREGHRGRVVDRHVGRGAGAAGDPAHRGRLLQAARRSHRRRRPGGGHRDVLLRARARLHRVDAVRPQPHRPRARSARPTSPASRRGS